MVGGDGVGAAQTSIRRRPVEGVNHRLGQSLVFHDSFPVGLRGRVVISVYIAFSVSFSEMKV